MSPRRAAESRWGSPFWADLFERVGSTLVYSLITLISMDNILEGPDWETLWPILVLPVLLSLLKGLAANFKDPASGASLLDAPPEGEGPTLPPDDTPTPDPYGQRGAATTGGIVTTVFVVLGVFFLLVLIF